ncbi:MAG: DUF748 domain-containing protein [Hydrogenophaga sp.]|uniref:DUF748 domain-containing protein n=1 Tax=Hydrogenophaga sp. TaxID=1904254 RepID=UPI0026098532|nr:DUF748 domain-containing protein [Hydrogenophaga sp.]MDM7942468.1 DUF748 domain-containing protein [Hydrogenophaga sp.]
MSSRPTQTPGKSWFRRFAWTLVGVMLLWLITWLVVPVLLKWQLQKQASELLGRGVTVQRVDFRPWSLELVVEGLRVAAAQGPAEQLSVARLYVNAELQSLLRLAPVIDALQIEQPRLALRHLGGGRYDVDDILQRLNAPASDDRSEPARFALFNLALAGGEFTFVDDPVGATHRLRGLTLSVPFLSNLASRREVVTEPRLAFELNGSAFDSKASSTPFAAHRETDATLSIPALDLAPYFPYWPAAWPVKPEAGVLSLDLKLAFLQRDAPQVWLSGDVALSGLKVVERSVGGEAAGVLSWERLGVRLNRVEPLARRVDLAAIELAAPSLNLSRDTRGQINLVRLAAGLVPPHQPAPTVQAPAAASVPWELVLGRLDLERGRIHWRDEAVQPMATEVLEAVRVQASGLSWPVRAPVPFEVSAGLGSSEVGVKGSVTDAAAQAELFLGEIALRRFSSYMKGAMQPALDGRVGAHGRIEWRAPQGDQAAVLKLLGGRIDVNDLVLGPARQPLASLKRLLIDDLQVDLVQRSAEVGGLTLTQPRLPLERGHDGAWMFESWRLPAPKDRQAVKAPAAEAAPWRVGLARLQVSGGSLGFVDRLPAEPVTLDITNLQLDLKDLRPFDAGQKDMALSVRARVGSGPSSPVAPGQVVLTGALRLPEPATAGGAGLRLDARTELERLPAHALVPYVADRLNLELLRADASYRGRVQGGLADGALALQLEGDAALDDLSANTLSPAEDLLAWKSLQVRGLQLAMSPGRSTQLRVRETVLSDYFARVIIDEAGKINLQGLLKPSQQLPAGDVPAQADAAAGGPAPGIGLGPISLVNGRVLFSDRFIKPNYTSTLSELTGSLGAFSNGQAAGTAPELAALSLRGRAEGTAALEIEGRLNPLAQPLALDIQGRVRHLELPPLSPYTVKYAGYGIERGKLSVDVAYRIDPDGQLSASNQIVLNQLSFGERVAGSEAPNLPVKLAVALLADRNGVIDINLPVSGSINDPQFRLAPIIFKLIFNLIGKALTAPFSLIASAFGGGAESPGQVAFAPGSAVLAAETRQQLASVAKALAERPALQITVVGHSDLEAERSGYQRVQLEARLLAEKRRLLARNGQPIPDVLAVGAEEYPALLKEVYRRADMPKPRNLIGIVKDIPQSDMEALLLASIPVTSDALRDLAVARGQAVKDFLASRSLPEDRMFLGAPQLVRQGEGWRPQAELRLAPR